MPLVTTIQGARTALTVAGFGTLASATYAVSANYNADTAKPQDVVVEVEAATTNTPAGNRQVTVFVKASLDGTNFQSGPESGTAATDELDLTHIGNLPMNTATTVHRKAFSVMTALGFLPRQFRVVVRNDLGVAITSGAVFTAEIQSNV